MANIEKVKAWLDAGKQVGKSVLREEAGEEYYVAVGIQKWNGKYKLYADKVKVAEFYWEKETEEIIEVEDFENLAALVEAKSFFLLSELTPLKGSKIFNPAF